MSTTMKVILGILIGGMLVCALAGAGAYLALHATGRMLDRAVQDDPANVGQIAASIANYALPDGFDSGVAMQAAGMAFVSHTGADGHSHAMFFQLPSGVHVDQAEIERQFKQTAGKGQVGDRQVQVVDQIETIICGQQTVVVISEGVNSDGQIFREATATFDGRGGQALVVYEAPVSAWDQATVDAFFASIQQ